MLILCGIFCIVWVFSSTCWKAGLVEKNVNHKSDMEKSITLEMAEKQENQ